MIGSGIILYPLMENKEGEQDRTEKKEDPNHLVDEEW